MITRTPVRAGPATVWVEPHSGTVRFGQTKRNRTLIAGLVPECYLLTSVIDGVLQASVFDPGAKVGWRFAPNRGVAAAVRTVVKPSWCVAIEATLPDAGGRVVTWLEVGVDVHGALASCSIPLGRLPQLQAGLMQYGIPLTYITQLSDVQPND